MFKFVMIGTALVGLGLGSTTSASAQAARPDPGLASPSTTPATQVQYRRGLGGGGFARPGWGGRGWGGRGWGGGWGGRGYYYGRGWNNGWGYGAAGLGLGLATGALIGGAIASQPYYGYESAPAYGGDAVSYCMSRFKSYDPGSGTYLGYDGYRHPCP